MWHGTPLEHISEQSGSGSGEDHHRVLLWHREPPRTAVSRHLNGDQTLLGPARCSSRGHESQQKPSIGVHVESLKRSFLGRPVAATKDHRCWKVGKAVGSDRRTFLIAMEMFEVRRILDELLQDCGLSGVSSFLQCASQGLDRSMDTESHLHRTHLGSRALGPWGGSLAQFHLRSHRHAVQVAQSSLQSTLSNRRSWLETSSPAMESLLSRGDLWNACECQTPDCPQSSVGCSGCARTSRQKRFIGHLWKCGDPISNDSCE
mmetsp:Transcript_9761/g.21438  ORF Transcript_9761/g.21438 Transcript_9761/m.21438 type:complete len:261 (+) Transcript_9761:1175-1957(+)